MTNIMQFLKFEEELNFKKIMEIYEKIEEDFSEEERRVISSAPYFKNKTLKYGLTDSILLSLKSALSLKLFKDNGEYYYRILGGQKIRFKTLYRILSWCEVLVGFNPVILKNLKGKQKAIINLIIELLVENSDNLKDDIRDIRDSFKSIVKPIVLDPIFNREIEDSIKVFQPFFGDSFNKMLKEDDEFIVVDPNTSLSDLTERAIDKMDLEDNVILNSIYKEYIKLFHMGEKCTFMSPFRNLTPSFSINQSCVKVGLTMFDSSFRDEDKFYDLFNNQDEYDYYYDFLKYAVKIEYSVINKKGEYYILVSRESRDNVYVFESFEDGLTSSLKSLISLLSSILDYMNSDSNNSDLSYMISDKNKESKSNSHDKSKAYSNPHITFVRGFWRKSKYGVLHHVRPSKRFYGNPEYMNKKIRTLIVLK